MDKNREGFKLKKEIDTGDLIKSLVTILGVIFAFCFVTTIELRNDTLKTRLQLTEQIPKLHPSIQTGYENLLKENGMEVMIRMNLKVLSPLPVYFFKPNFRIFNPYTNQELSNDQFQIINNDYSGDFSSGSEYSIQYNCILKDTIKDLSNYKIRMTFDVQINNNTKEAYKKLYEGFDENLKSKIDTLTYKTHIYEEFIKTENARFEKIFE